MKQEQNERELVYKLMYHALLEIREESYQKGYSKIHVLSNLFHNVPLMLMKVEESNQFEGILEKLKDKSEELGVGKWLNNVKKQI